MSIQLGELLARGSRSVVHAWGAGAVAKVPLPSMPDGWIRQEAVFTDAVRAAGAPAPRVLGIETIDGRDISIYERVPGPSMWDAALAAPGDAAAYGRVLSELQTLIFSVRPPLAVPTQFTRLSCKIRNAARTVDASLSGVIAMLAPTPGPMQLCHGDLHPKNVILSPVGPVAVDWFDASRGRPVGDVARTSLLLLGPRGEGVGAHLPGATASTAAVVAELHDAYLASVAATVALEPRDLHHWRVVESAARVAEGVETAALLSFVAAHAPGGRHS